MPPLNLFRIFVQLSWLGTIQKVCMYRKQGQLQKYVVIFAVAKRNRDEGLIVTMNNILIIADTDV